MNDIQILDCTLRDGGYCNEWRFGFENARKITQGLIDANVEIIECGFITNRVGYDSDVTKFTSFEEVSTIIPSKRNGKLFVAMINYGEYEADDIPKFDGSSVDGIRVAFHKKDGDKALEFCKRVKEKGYLLFIQAMVSLSYIDDEFLSLIKSTNELEPYAFYIVDSFGAMKEKDLTRLFYMVEHNLDEKIRIGFHSHNNMQLAYSNAQILTNILTNRRLIIDSSIYGMGRGAGNLNTELFVEYLNENIGKKYELKPLLNLIDEILDEFHQRNYWGYSLPNYISASHNAHPNYAGYLDDKKTLTIEAMNEIFDMMDEDKKNTYDKLYIENLYLRYMENGRVQEERENELKKNLEGKQVLLIAPGKSSIDEIQTIKDFAMRNDVIVVSINHDYLGTSVDYIFSSNLRRFREIEESKKEKCIITLNIPSDRSYLRTGYKKLTNDVDGVNDNAGLMAIKFFIDYGVENIALAGFDGYSHDVEENYGDKSLEFTTKEYMLDKMNQGMKKVLMHYSRMITISFVTKPRHIKLG